MRLGPYPALVVIGGLWGLTIPITKVAVSTGHHPIGLLAWQTTLMTLFLTGLILVRRGAFPLYGPALVLYLAIALLGTLVPNAFSYSAAAHLPAGILAILIAVVPMFALPIAITLGLERPQARRLFGVLLGLFAIVLIVGPEASLPDPGDVPWVFVALVASCCYGMEGNYLALKGRGGLDPVQVLWGASLIGALISVPLSAITGTWIAPPDIWTKADLAIPAIAVLHCAAYTGYVWLVGASGSVFASQVAYVVTAAGVMWSMLLLGERYALWIWLAFAVMIAGLTLVQPRPGRDGEPA